MNIDNTYFDGLISQIYPPELQLNKANSSDTEPALSHVTDLNTRNNLLTTKLLNQGYRYHKLRKAFSKFNRRHSDLVSKFNVGLKSLLQQGLSEPEFYGDLVYKFNKIYACNVVKSFFDIKRLGTT